MAVTRPRISTSTSSVKEASGRVIFLAAGSCQCFLPRISHSLVHNAANARASETPASVQAWLSSPVARAGKYRWDNVVVTPEMLPATMMVAPNSPSARANASKVPPAIAAGQRQCDGKEHAPFARAQRAGHLLQRRITSSSRRVPSVPATEMTSLPAPMPRRAR